MDNSYYYSTDSASVVAGLIGFFAVFYMIVLAFVIALYVFQSLGLMTLAKKRNIQNPWMAWIPFAGTYLLGKVADDVTERNGKRTSYRKILLGLQIALTAITLIFTVVIMVAAIMYAGTSANISGDIWNNPEFFLDNGQNYVVSGGSLAGTLDTVMPIVVMLMMICVLPLSIIYCVFYYIALHKIYKDYVPGEAVMYLVISILFSIQGIFMFMIRDKAPQSIVNPVGYWKDGLFYFTQPQHPYNGYNNTYNQNPQHPQQGYNQYYQQPNNNFTWQQSAPPPYGQQPFNQPPQ
ncbi:MAG: hypothetical protein K0R90_1065, partial [Oscillospiraceae bacterium]|nr:hypothetical protein [Oscillospiraceae bacterium]